MRKGHGWTDDAAGASHKRHGPYVTPRAGARRAGATRPASPADAALSADVVSSADAAPPGVPEIRAGVALAATAKKADEPRAAERADAALPAVAAYLAKRGSRFA